MTVFELMEAAILSGQVPDADVIELMERYPEFGAWFRARGRARHDPQQPPDDHSAAPPISHETRHPETQS